ncbi:MAG: ABC transporter ATP-binding protein [Sneathiellaceae bacterium]
MLNINNITVRYGQLTAVRGVTIKVAQGESVCVVGPNGAGKTTTLLTVSGVLTPAEGTVEFDGGAVTGINPENIARLGISHVPEGRHVFGLLTVEENLKIGTAMRRDRSGVAADIEKVLEYFPRLRERLKQPAGKLSGGEQQMLVIGRALLTRPKLITVDEPSLGLAPKIVDQVYEILERLRQEEGVTLLIVEQSTKRALDHAERLYVLRSGMVQLEGRTADLSAADVERAYFGFDEHAATA